MKPYTIVDAEQLRAMFALSEDGTLVWKAPPKFHPDLIGQSAGALTPSRHGKSYWNVQINGRKVKRSRIVFCLTTGRWPTDQIDHIDGNSLNDNPCNLREATATQNAWNHKGRRKASPLPMGVRQAKSGRFVARIAVNKRKLTIGSFDTIEAAQSAYRLARAVNFGEFA